MGFKYKVSESLFYAYENIRRMGKYNMFTQAREVCDLIGTDLDTYCHLQKHLQRYQSKYLKITNHFKRGDKKNENK